MVILRRETEDAQCAANVFLGLGTVRVAEQASDREISALDPQPRCLADRLEHHKTAVGPADKSVRVIGIFHRARAWLQFPGKRNSQKMGGAKEY